MENTSLASCVLRFVQSTWTELTCNKSTQLRDTFTGHARQHHDLIGCTVKLGQLVLSQCVCCEHSHYDTIWDAILTCARKPTWVSLMKTIGNHVFRTPLCKLQYSSWINLYTAHNNKSVISFVRQLTTWHCPLLLLSASRAAIDWYSVATEPTAANPLQ